MTLRITRRRGEAVQIVDHFTGRTITVRPVNFRPGKDGGRHQLEIDADGCTVRRVEEAPLKADPPPY